MTRRIPEQHRMLDAHVDDCMWCRHHPDNLCETGEALLQQATNEDIDREYDEVFGSIDPNAHLGASEYD